MPDVFGQPDPQTPAVSDTGSGQPGSPEPAWTMPENLRGKSSDDLAKMYGELEQRLGQQGQELGQTRQQLGQWNQWVQNWDPVLRAAGYRPDRVAEALQRVSTGEDTAADRKVVQKAEQAARSWQEALTPHEQEQWINQTIESRTNAAVQPLSQQLYDGLNAAVGYFNRYGDFALRAIEAKLTNPALRDIPLSQILQVAVQQTSQPPDPIGQAAAQLSMPQMMQQFATQMQQQATQRAAEANKNASMTTFVGAGGTPRPYRATVQAPPPTNPMGQPLRSQASAGTDWETAKANAVNRVAAALANLH